MRHFQIRKMCLFQIEKVFTSNTKIYHFQIRKMPLFQIRECIIFKKKKRIASKYEYFAILKCKKYIIFKCEKWVCFKYENVSFSNTKNVVWTYFQIWMLVIFSTNGTPYFLTKSHSLVPFTLWDIGQYVYWWRCKFRN